MSDIPNSNPKTPPPSAAANQTHKGIKIFTYPKVIFLWPTLVAAILCAIVMLVIHNRTEDPYKGPAPPAAAAASAESSQAQAQAKRFSSPQNIVAMLFLTIFFFNLLIMALDFPRFTIIIIILGIFALGFFLLWLSVYLNIWRPLVNFMEHIYAAANGWFYTLVAVAILVNLVIVYLTRFLDYWELLPNEILHNHGPWSDLERFPTTGLKFDKEIPDILEYALLRAGRLILHVPNERKAIVLDNVLWIDHKEEALKKLMSRLEVRITSDQEVNEPI